MDKTQAPSVTAESPSVADRISGAHRPSRSLWRIGIDRFRKNKLAVISLAFLLLMYFTAAAAPIIAPYNPNANHPTNVHARPSTDHILGTDENGRDVLSRLIYGSRASMLVALVAVGISISIGTLVGGTAGFVGKFADTILMRLTDGMLSVPYFFLVLIVVSVFGANLRNLIIVIGISTWMLVARIVRGEVIRLNNFDFVLAARAIGATNPRILFRHILPHTTPLIIVAATLGVASAILLESALSYLGLGIQPPTPSWGNMLSNSQAYLWSNPLLPVYPGLLIFFTVLAYNFVGDALRDAFDPQYRD
jgi:peptide/nickel transport system permease protein